MNGERMPHVMKTWLEAASIMALHMGVAPQMDEDSVCGPQCQRASGASHKKGVSGCAEWSFLRLRA